MGKMNKKNKRWITEYEIFLNESMDFCEKFLNIWRKNVILWWVEYFSGEKWKNIPWSEQILSFVLANHNWDWLQLYQSSYTNDWPLETRIDWYMTMTNRQFIGYVKKNRWKSFKHMLIKRWKKHTKNESKIK